MFNWYWFFDGSGWRGRLNQVGRTKLNILIIVYVQYRNRAAEHKYPSQNNSINGLPAEEVLHYPATKKAVYDLGEGDKEVKDAHVYAHFFGRDRSLKDGIRHSQDTRPGQADSYHRKNKQRWVMDKKYGYQPDTTNSQ